MERGETIDISDGEVDTPSDEKGKESGIAVADG